MDNLNLKKKYIVKIPKEITTLYCEEKQIITFIGPIKQKSLKLEVKILLISHNNQIHVSNSPINKTSSTGRKKANSMQGTTVSEMRHIIIETTYTLYRKLSFVGVGYRAFHIEDVKNQLFFKLGYSHLVYFKIPKPFTSFCAKSTKLFVFGNASYNNITQIAASIRSCKKPEPYKGKGILHYNEKITIKKGKKI
jgi:large subunit ribosomal protein L6